jgi:hypothetical protein
VRRSYSFSPSPSSTHKPRTNTHITYQNPQIQKNIAFPLGTPIGRSLPCAKLLFTKSTSKECEEPREVIALSHGEEDIIEHYNPEVTFRINYKKIACHPPELGIQGSGGRNALALLLYVIVFQQRPQSRNLSTVQEAESSSACREQVRDLVRQADMPESRARVATCSHTKHT